MNTRNVLFATLVEEGGGWEEEEEEADEAEEGRERREENMTVGNRDCASFRVTVEKFGHEPSKFWLHPKLH